MLHSDDLASVPVEGATAHEVVAQNFWPMTAAVVSLVSGVHGAV
jgi:hypothetical protein